MFLEYRSITCFLQGTDIQTNRYRNKLVNCCILQKHNYKINGSLQKNIHIYKDSQYLSFSNRNISLFVMIHICVTTTCVSTVLIIAELKLSGRLSSSLPVDIQGNKDKEDNLPLPYLLLKRRLSFQAREQCSVFQHLEKSRSRYRWFLFSNICDVDLI